MYFGMHRADPNVFRVLFGKGVHAVIGNVHSVTGGRAGRAMAGGVLRCERDVYAACTDQKQAGGHGSDERLERESGVQFCPLDVKG
ncbi:MAG: hypothetical protein EPO43_07435 [Rugosibacter sp.]|nr:MAG: hypothetical protein EPO43_07435 [Rugosibacter sp.]